MATLSHSPAAAAASAARRPKTPPRATAPITSSLRSLPSAIRLRPLPLKLSFRSPAAPAPRRRGATMMDVAAASYANAIAEIAKSNDTLESTLEDLEKIGSIFASPVVPSFFANPTITVEKKREFVAEIAQTSNLQPHVANFLNVVIDMRRVDLLPEIIKEFELAYNRTTGTEVAVVSSVVRLDSQHLTQIAKTVQQFTDAKNVRIKSEIDPSLIAGFTIRYGDSGSKLIDMSVKRQLEEITSQLDFSNVTLAG